MKIYYYLKKLWHQYIVCDAFLITFVDNNKIYVGEILKTVYGDKIEILWEEEKYYQEYRRYYKYWVRNIK